MEVWVQATVPLSGTIGYQIKSKVAGMVTSLMVVSQWGAKDP